METEVFWRDHPSVAARKQRLDVDRDSLTNPPKPKARPKPTRTQHPQRNPQARIFTIHWMRKRKLSGETIPLPQPANKARQRRQSRQDNTRKGASGSYGPTRASVQMRGMRAHMPHACMLMSVIIMQSVARKHANWHCLFPDPSFVQCRPRSASLSPSGVGAGGGGHHCMNAHNKYKTPK